MSKILGLFDKAYVINLDRRPDRLALITADLDKMGIPFERFPAVSYQAPYWSEMYNLGIDRKGIGNYGCNVSHMTILKKAVAEGLSNVLIIEDDAWFLDGFMDKAAPAVAELATQPWDMFYFHGGTEKCSPVSPLLSRRSESPWRTQCYAVNRHVMDQLADLIAKPKGYCWYAIDATYVSFFRGEILVPTGDDLVKQRSDMGTPDSDIYVGD